MTSASPAVSSTERDFAGRQAPWSNEAEQAVLGAMLLDQDAALKAAELLDDTMFYREGHRVLFRAMVSLVERGDVIDPVTLRDELVRRGDLERAGGMEYLGGLIDVVPTAANVEYHGRIVRDKSMLRRLVEAATGIIQDVYEGRGVSGEVLDNAEHRIFQVAQLKRAEEFSRIKELIWPTMERIEKLQSGHGAVSGTASGFLELDRLTAGFQKADLVIIAARPSMGKTAFALNCVQHAAIEHNVGVAVFSLEMSKDQLVQRLLCSEGLVDAQRLRRGQLRDDDYPKLARAAGLLGTAPIWIDDSAALTPLAMRSKARRLKAEHDIGLLVVDYLQLMQGPTDAESRQQEISYISRSLKALAKELDIPVLALSQLSRAPDQRSGDHRPQLSDLRESGAIEQDADVVLFIFRPEMYYGPSDPKDGSSIEGHAELIVGKQRNGPTGHVPLYFRKEFTRFVSRDPLREAPQMSGGGGGDAGNGGDRYGG
jgi:replicative DNA helicase